LGQEIAEIDVLLEEAAELVDDNHQKNPNYHRLAFPRHLFTVSKKSFLRGVAGLAFLSIRESAECFGFCYAD